MYQYLIKGFLWGLGAAISVSLVVSVYMLYIANSIEMSVTQDRIESIEEINSQIVSKADPKVLEMTLADGGVYIISKINDLGVMNSKFNVRFTINLLNGSKRVCKDRLVEEYGDKSHIIYQTYCELPISAIADISSVSANLAHRY